MERAFTQEKKSPVLVGAPARERVPGGLQKPCVPEMESRSIAPDDTEVVPPPRLLDFDLRPGRLDLLLDLFGLSFGHPFFDGLWRPFHQGFCFRQT